MRTRSRDPGELNRFTRGFTGYVSPMQSFTASLFMQPEKRILQSIERLSPAEFFKACSD
jgi:hypothetical protein